MITENDQLRLKLVAHLCEADYLSERFIFFRGLPRDIDQTQHHVIMGSASLVKRTLTGAPKACVWLE